MVSSFWTFSRQALVPRLFRDHSPSLDRGQAGAHRTQLPDELLTSKSWFILLIRATTAHFHRIDVDLAEPVAIVIAGIFAGAVADSFVAIAPGVQAGIDVVLIGVDQRAAADRPLDDRLDRDLLDVGQQVEHDFTTALDQSEDRRLLLLQGAAATLAFQPSPASLAAFFSRTAEPAVC